MSANRTLEYSTYVACSSEGALSYSPTFDYSAVSVALGTSGAKPIRISLAGAATATSFMVSTGAQVFWSPIPSRSGVFGVYCTACGGEYSLSLFG